MSKSLAVLGAAFAVIVAGSASARADVVQLDQEYIDSFGVQGAEVVDMSTWYQYAQTFTVGKTGVLDSVALDLLAPPVRGATGALLQYGSGDLIVDIRTLDSSGAPTVANSGANVLGSVTLVGGSIPHSTHGFISIDFSHLLTPVSVTSGELLAITFRDAAPDGIGIGAFTDAYGGTTPSYASGQAWQMYQSNNPQWTGLASDLNFKTFVLAPLQEVPLPSASWMGFVVLAGVVGIRWNRRRRRLAIL